MKTLRRRVAASAATALVLTGLGLQLGAGHIGEAVAFESASAQPENMNQRIAALVVSLKQSREAIRQYEWIETTTVSLKGDQKAEIEKRCYYGDDGKLTKELLTQPAPTERKRGLRGMIAERKKAELSSEVKLAVETLHQYVPPDHEKIQKVKDVGDASIDLVEPGKLARLNFKNYRVQGDVLSIDVDLGANRPTAITVKSTIDSPPKPFKCEVSFGVLKDGTLYPEETRLDLEQQEVKVVVENSGYRKRS